jgi:two-component system, OmpR family, alkaline phosphatase synthesis response regulator PhoP
MWTSVLRQCPHGDSNSGFGLERAASWSTRRWGRGAAILYQRKEKEKEKGAHLLMTPNSPRMVSMSGELILVVDDEANIVELARLYLEREGFRVSSLGDGRAALEQVQKEPPALMVLDLMLPGLDGFEVCRQVRATSDLPIIMVTARDDEIDKIVGLELGADDYLAKPFNPRELVARVKAILRRGSTARGAKDETAPIPVGDVTIDQARREVTVTGRPATLRTKEFDLLHTLAENRGLVLTREPLLNLVWGFDFYGQKSSESTHAGCEIQPSRELGLIAW